MKNIKVFLLIGLLGFGSMQTAESIPDQRIRETESPAWVQVNQARVQPVENKSFLSKAWNGIKNGASTLVNSVNPWPKLSPQSALDNVFNMIKKSANYINNEANNVLDMINKSANYINNELDNLSYTLYNYTEWLTRLTPNRELNDIIACGVILVEIEAVLFLGNAWLNCEPGTFSMDYPSLLGLGMRNGYHSRILQVGVDFLYNISHSYFTNDQDKLFIHTIYNCVRLGLLFR